MVVGGQKWSGTDICVIPHCTCSAHFCLQLMALPTCSQAMQLMFNGMLRGTGVAELCQL